MIVLSLSPIILKVFLDTGPRIYFSLEVQAAPLAIPKLVTPLLSGAVLQTELVPGTANASNYHLELLLSKVIISI